MGCTITLGNECISCTCDAALAVRLGELGIRPGALAVFRPQLYPGALVQIRRPRTDYQIVGGQS